MGHHSAGAINNFILKSSQCNQPRMPKQGRSLCGRRETGPPARQRYCGTIQRGRQVRLCPALVFLRSRQMRFGRLIRRNLPTYLSHTKPPMPNLFFFFAGLLPVAREFLFCSGNDRRRQILGFPFPTCSPGYQGRRGGQSQHSVFI